MGSMKDKAIFALEVAVVIGVIYAFQKKVMKLPVVGEFLPGGQ